MQSRARFPRFGHAFHRLHRAPGALEGQHEARELRLTVDQHGAGAAFALAKAPFSVTGARLFEKDSSAARQWRYHFAPIAKETLMTLRIGDTAPNFQAETTEGRVDFHQWIGDKWAVLFSHPKDFTPVCTTELGYMAKIESEFTKRNAQLIGLSVDPVADHSKWAADIEETQGAAVKYPMIGDTDLSIAKMYNMLPAEEPGTSDGRTAAANATVRSVFIIGPDKKIKLMLTYPMTTGRNFDEILRVLDSMQLTDKHKVATPVNWKNGEDVLIAGSVSDDDAKTLFPAGWKAPKPYLRVVKQPGT